MSNWRRNEGASAIGRREVTGIVLVDKPAGLTSNRVLQRVKRLFGAAKAGHTGSLDPAATGMLPVCLGAATKVCGLLLDARKTYRVAARFGVATDTGDADGEIVGRCERGPVTQSELAAAIEALRGESRQTPPMYSALKYKGRRLYELARRGQEVPREPRTITIDEIGLESYAWPEFEFRVTCSKGTYVRVLVTDIARALGTLAHVTRLRRLCVGPYREWQMHRVETLEAAADGGFDALDAHLLGIDSALTDYPSVSLDSESAERLGQGQRVALGPARGACAGRVRVYAAGGRFVGIGEVDASGLLRPRRLFSSETLGAAKGLR